MTEHHVLVVEDDSAIASEIVRGLRSRDYRVTLATDGAQASAVATRERFDLIVLDIMLPEKDGFTLLDEWHDRLSTPIVVLTARTDLDDRLRAFEKGAIDFLPKPFWFEELAARVSARLGRPKAAPTQRKVFGATVVDLDARAVQCEGKPAELTPHEFNLVAYLVTREGRAISRQQLAEHALRVDDVVSDRTVDTHIARIRKKLGEDGKAFVTVWGVGYRFHPQTA